MKNLEHYLAEGLNEGIVYPANVKVGDIATNYDNKTGEVKMIVKAKDMNQIKKYDSSGILGEYGDYLEPDEYLIAVEIDNKSLVYIYGEDGAFVYA